MILYDHAVEETGSRMDHKVTALSYITPVVSCTFYACQPINAVFKTLPIVAPVLVLENGSSLQSTGSQVSVLPYM